jgi:hypothetical protein
LLLHSLMTAHGRSARAASELAAATVLAVAVPYIVVNEGIANWQSLWLCAAFAGLAVTLARVRAGQS